MRVSDLGEFGLIDVLSKLVERRSKSGEAWKRLVLGIGDDCAVWRCGAGRQIATIDALVEGIHFQRDMLSWEEVGWKSLAVNISDIAAMGGIPRYALVSVSLPGHFEAESAESMYRGMLDVADRYEVAIVGGNITKSDGVSVHIALYGEEGPSGRILTRSGAREGDAIAVTGELGAAAAGLRTLLEHRQASPDFQAYTQAFARPIARVVEGLELARLGVNAAIDVSDGLISDLGHICKASRLGASVDVDLVPIAVGIREHFPEMALDWGLGGGEDYELLFTCPSETLDEVQSKLQTRVTQVGQMIRDPAYAVTLSGAGTGALSHLGWDHFSE